MRDQDRTREQPESECERRNGRVRPWKLRSSAPSSEASKRQKSVQTGNHVPQWADGREVCQWAAPDLHSGQPARTAMGITCSRSDRSSAPRCRRSGCRRNNTIGILTPHIDAVGRWVITTSSYHVAVWHRDHHAVCSVKDRVIYSYFTKLNYGKFHQVGLRSPKGAMSIEQSASNVTLLRPTKRLMIYSSWH